MTISGTVTNGRLAPLEGVTVEAYPTADYRLVNPMAFTVTGKNGAFTLSNVKCDGNYILLAISKPGYVSKTYTQKIAGPFLENLENLNLWINPVQTKPVLVSIDPTVKKPLQMIFGFNNNVFGIPYRFTEPQFVEAIKNSGAGLMRFPGGTIANFYNWEADDFATEDLKQIKPETYLSRDKYATEEEYKADVENLRKYVNNYIGRTENNRAKRGKYGYRDFLEMTKQANAEIIYVGNVSIAPKGKNPFDHIVDWLQKLKNDGVNVKYLEFGNEINSGNQALLNDMKDHRKYLQECERVSKKIKQIFPQIKLGIIADNLLNKVDGPVPEIDIQNQEIVDYPNHDFFDAIMIHGYLGLREHIDYDFSVKKDKLLAYSQYTTKTTYDYFREKFPGKEVWITEIGYWVNIDDKAELTTAIFNAMLENDYLLHWTDYDDKIKSYLKHMSVSPNNSVNSVTFYDMTKDTVLVKNAIYYGFSMVAGAMNNSGYKLGIVTKDDQVYTERTNMWIPERDKSGKIVTGKGSVQNVNVEVEELTARAFLGKDGRTIYIPFVNKSQAQKLIRLDIKGKNLAGTSAEVQSISGALTDKNNAAEPFKVTPATYQTAADASHRPARLFHWGDRGQNQINPAKMS